MVEPVWASAELVLRPARRMARGPSCTVCQLYGRTGNGEPTRSATGAKAEDAGATGADVTKARGSCAVRVAAGSVVSPERKQYFPNVVARKDPLNVTASAASEGGKRPHSWR
jgi:hypothetical protein